MTLEKAIVNAQIVLENKVITGCVRIAEGRIADIYEGEAPTELLQRPGCEIIEAQGNLLLPGLIDVHCDAIEKEVQPRPNTLYPMDLALYELERKLVGNGITTMYQSVSLGVGLSLRGDHVMVDLIRQIERHRQHRSMIRHRIHLRYEIIHLAGLELAEQLVSGGAVDYLSFMNHAPGQGQYRIPGSFEAYVMKNQGVDRETVKSIADNALQMQEAIDWSRLRKLADNAISRGIAIASHDDDAMDKIDEAIRLGVTVSEFPLNLETARYAAKRNIYVCVGAPNVVRGGSHDKNMSAIEAIKDGSAHILCSDYLPSSLLPAVFKVADTGMSLPEAVQMATLNPARAMGIAAQAGSIACGKQADLLLVQRQDDGYPCIRRTIVNGSSVYSADFCDERI
jgi:alpha-D-ribose 1-methylphosphonate 5-triphosphate diphosphatase